jgi:hypothetical protein
MLATWAPDAAALSGNVFRNIQIAAEMNGTAL